MPNFSRIDPITIVSVFVATYALIWQLYSVIKSKKVIITLGLDVKIEKTDITLSCSVTNSGTKAIYPYLVNLYVEKGVFNSNKNIYEFDNCLDHRFDDKGEVFDCKLAEHCKNEKCSAEQISFPQNANSIFEKTVKYCYNVRQLSHFSLVHIAPGEAFREDIVIQLKESGVYRAILIYTGKNYNDCICRTIKFKIEKEAK